MLRRLVRSILQKAGYTVIHRSVLSSWLKDEFRRNADVVSDNPLADIQDEDEFMEAYEKCKVYTMTSVERMFALFEAVRYVVSADVPGDIVECGVWKGGSVMLCAHALQALGNTERRIYLYDTFAGMTEPSEIDQDYSNRHGHDQWQALAEADRNFWCYASLDEVRQNVLSMGYPEGHFVFVEGKVEDTIPATVPDRIALLRLDTDWYGSTRHELVHLFPLLAKGGVLILDDYGFWRGHRAAADEYFAECGLEVLLTRVDLSCRMMVKS